MMVVVVGIGRMGKMGRTRTRTTYILRATIAWGRRSGRGVGGLGMGSLRGRRTSYIARSGADIGLLEELRMECARVTRILL